MFLSLFHVKQKIKTCGYKYMVNPYQKFLHIKIMRWCAERINQTMKFV